MWLEKSVEKIKREAVRRSSGFCNDHKIHKQVQHIKAAIDHNNIGAALSLIVQADDEVFEYPITGELASKADQYPTLLSYFFAKELLEPALHAIDRMTPEQLGRRVDRDGSNIFHYTMLPNATIAALEKSRPEDLSALQRTKYSHIVPLALWMKYNPRPEILDLLIEKTPSHAIGFVPVIDNGISSPMYGEAVLSLSYEQIDYDGGKEKKGRFFQHVGIERIIAIIRKAPTETFIQHPEIYKGYSQLSKFNGSYAGAFSFESSNPLYPEVAEIVEAIEQKMAGTLAPYVSQSAVMIHRSRSTPVSLPAFNPDEMIEAALTSGRASDAIQIGRSILDDCAVLFERFHKKNLESLKAAADASDVLRGVVAQTRQHARIADEVASGQKSLNPPGLLVRQLARAFPSLDPIGLLEEGLSGAGDDVRRSLEASQSLLRAYEDIQELRGPIEERLDRLQTSLGKAVDVMSERIDSVPEDSKEQKDAIMLREIFEATARSARVSGALIGVNAKTADLNARIEGKFVVAVMEIQSALNVALTNATIGLSKIKEAGTPELRREAALVLQDQSRKIAERMNAFEEVVVERGRDISAQDSALPAAKLM